MNPLRINATRIAKEITDLGQRFGMATDPNLPPERAVDMASMSQMAEDHMTML